MTRESGDLNYFHSWMEARSVRLIDLPAALHTHVRDPHGLSLPFLDTHPRNLNRATAPLRLNSPACSVFAIAYKNVIH